MYKEIMVNSVAKIIMAEMDWTSRDLVRGMSIDSRATKPGDLFFALKGDNTNGHKYTGNAVANGALGVVVQEKTGSGKEMLVRDTMFALGELARNYRRGCSAKTIAITGTNGKTTVKDLVAAIIAKRFRTLASKMNYNSLIGLPLTILEMSGNEEYLVLEMGTSSPGEIRRLCEIALPTIGLITTIGPGHVEGLRSIGGIKKEKLSLIESLPADGFGLVGEGIDDIQHKHVFRFSLNDLDAVKLGEDASIFTYLGETFTTRLLGYSNVYNCLAALALTSRIGIDISWQKDAIAEAKPEPGRMEPIKQHGFLIINDTYNANPLSMKSAIDFVAALNRKKVAVLGDMLELGAESRSYHVEIGKYANDRCDLLLCLGQKSSLYRGKHFTDGDELTTYLMDNLEGDEVILFKASRALKFEELVQKLLRRLRG